jgi:hypothetical protein
MLNWALSAICIVLLVLIVHRLLGAMHSFHILQSALIGLEITEPPTTTDTVPETSSPLPSHPNAVNCGHQSLTVAQTTAPIAPDSADYCFDPDDSKTLYIASVQGTRFHKQDCSSVKRIRENNRRFFSHRVQAMESGYEPCSICNP